MEGWKDGRREALISVPGSPLTEGVRGSEFGVWGSRCGAGSGFWRSPSGSQISGFRFNQ